MAGNEDQVEQGVLNRTLNDWFEFVDLIRNEHANCPAYIYRGQAHNWPLKSKLDRFEDRFPTKRDFTRKPPGAFECTPVSRDEHLNAFKEAARGKTTRDIPDHDENEWWALAQHHGLATPMLDWTRSPFAALFFAFEEEQVNVSGELINPDRRYVYRVAWHLVEARQRKDEDEPFPFTPRLASTQRLINQMAICLRMPPRSELEDYIRGHYSQETGDHSIRARAILEIIDIPSDSRTECLKFLNKMGMNRLTLFPDLDGAAQYINTLWGLDFDTSLGQIRSIRETP